MNLSYFKKSKYSKEETIKNLKEVAQKEGLSILGEITLPKAGAILFQVCDSKWMDNILNDDRNLVGLTPCSVLILEKGNEVHVGLGNPAVLAGVTKSYDVQRLAQEAEEKFRRLLKDVTGAEDAKPVKIRVYSTATCPYCAMEKQWLETNKIDHEVVYVDRDQSEAERMVRETGQMGVPVTEIQYDDGEKEFVVGFDKARLSSILGVK